MTRRRRYPQDTDIVEALSAMAEQAEWQPPTTSASVRAGESLVMARHPVMTWLANVGHFVCRHPWRALAGVAVTLVCTLICRYFGATILAAALFYAGRQPNLHYRVDKNSFSSHQ